MSQIKRFCECDQCGEVNLTGLDIKKAHVQIIDENYLGVAFKCDKCGWMNHREIKIDKD